MILRHAVFALAALAPAIAVAQTTPPATPPTAPPAVTTPNTAPNPAAPVPGANSFTEEQAKKRIADAGFTGVSALTKDDKGVWRGSATKDGKTVQVAVDYQGNVVSQ